MSKFIVSIFLLTALLGYSQKYHNYTENINRADYWQQHVEYTMEIDMDVDTYQYRGKQEIVYTNHSPDTLDRVFYHLHFNAFQPGSEMDEHSRSVVDPDPRIGDRISKLQPHEIGYIKVNSLKQNQEAVAHKTVGTLLEVTLNKPILPGEKVTFSMDYEAQVPLQIRRSGRNSSEGVALSMTQWYPKLAEYDREGWHTDPYIGREFYGVWGNFDVKITIDSRYTLGGTGYLQNPNQVGHGYQDDPSKPIKHKKNSKITWHFIAPDVHDFTWAADPDYIHDRITGPNDIELHFLYKNDPEIIENWKNLQEATYDIFDFFNQLVGDYPYQQYSVIQGGDGGMEYAMCTLITGKRSFNSLVGVTIHEVAHSWFQFVLATNESKYSWFDEGFTEYISAMAVEFVLGEAKDFIHTDHYLGYYSMARSGKEQPLTTHADRFAENWLFARSSYSKGAVFAAQMEYLIGSDKALETLRRFYKEFAFTHPTPNDYIRTAEKVSGMQLRWYLNDFTETTNTIDYAIQEVKESQGKIQVTLKRIGLMPMPIDFYVFLSNGNTVAYHIPLRMMHGVKDNPFPGMERTILNDWPWALREYTFEIDYSMDQIKAMSIDGTGYLADVNLENNIYQP